MTPKEKAKELVNKFYLERSKDDLSLTIYWTSAIGCALIVVDEIINALKIADITSMDGSWYINEWLEVKKEIKSL
jgi:hypothetical protein